MKLNRDMGLELSSHVKEIKVFIIKTKNHTIYFLQEA